MEKINSYGVGMLFINIAEWRWICNEEVFFASANFVFK